MRNGGGQQVSKRGGFTLVEVLAAMAFLAILMPAIISGITIANRAGEVTERAAIAAQLADNKLNEMVVGNAWSSAESTGDFSDFPDYRWEFSHNQWTTDASMNELTLTVFFKVQGHEHSVRLSTLAGAQQ